MPHHIAGFIGATASIFQLAVPVGLDSRAWLGLSFSLPGIRVSAPPALLTLTIEAWDACSGRLGLRAPRVAPCPERRLSPARVPPAGYVKRRVHIVDSGRREELGFDIPSRDFARLARAPELDFSAGRARFRVRERMEMLREVLRRMTPSDRGSQ